MTTVPAPTGSSTIRRAAVSRRADVAPPRMVRRSSATRAGSTSVCASSAEGAPSAACRRRMTTPPTAASTSNAPMPARTGVSPNQPASTGASSEPRSAEVTPVSLEQAHRAAPQRVRDLALDDGRDHDVHDRARHRPRCPRRPAPRAGSWSATAANRPAPRDDGAAEERHVQPACHEPARDDARDDAADARRRPRGSPPPAGRPRAGRWRASPAGCSGRCP